MQYLDFIFSAMAQDQPPASYIGNSQQLQYDYSYGTSYGASYGEDDVKDSAWADRQNRK